MGRKIKYSRKDLKSPDEFLSTIGRATLWMKEHRNAVFAALAIAVLVSGGILGTRAYSRWQESKATRDLWPHLNRAREYLEAPTIADREKLERLEQFLAAHVNLHPDTRTAVFARYYLGSIAFLKGDFERSAMQFRSAIASGKEQGTIMDFLLREGLAQALEAKGDVPGAQTAYGEAAAAAGGELRTQAWMGQARMLEVLGRQDDARTLYRKILAENPDTPVKDLLEIKLSHMG